MVRYHVFDIPGSLYIVTITAYFLIASSALLADFSSLHAYKMVKVTLSHTMALYLVMVINTIYIDDIILYVQCSYSLADTHRHCLRSWDSVGIITSHCFVKLI